jgi:3-phytase
MDALLSRARRFTRVFVFASFVFATFGYGNELHLRLLGNYQSGIFDGAAAEIADYDPTTQRVFVTNDAMNRVDVIDISDPLHPIQLDAFDMSPHGAGVTSLSIHDNLVAIAVKSEPEQEKGRLVIVTTTGEFVAKYHVGSLPDMVKFTPDGTRILVAIEGEPNGDYTVDPEGGINIIDISNGPKNGELSAVLFSQHPEYNARAGFLREQGIRIFGPNASPARDFEPEYIAISANSRRAYVSLQENNAIAVINIKHPGIEDIFPLGFKDHSLPENSLDASNRDGGINLKTWPVHGLYLPDAVAVYEVGGNRYIVTANEGDSRDYDEFSEETRVADVELDSVAFADYPDLQDDENLGRLLITSTLGDEDGDGDFDKLYSFGGRSFSIWDVEGNLVFDSGNDFERILADILPDDFNSNNTENGFTDNRSDDKGPEPEALEIAQIGGRHYLFVGLERVGGVMIYDITNPMAPQFLSYTNNRDFSVDFDPDEITPSELARVGDLAPEEIVHVSAHDSPNGTDLLIVANEVSGSVSIYEIVTEPVQFPDVASTSSPEVIFETDEGVEVRNGGFGSGMDPHPSAEGYFYLLTGRGPNFDGANAGEKVFPVADFSPHIGLFRLQGDSLQKVRTTHLKRTDGTPITGLPNPAGFGGTGETPLDLDGNVLDFDEEGLDPEGIVALRDGTFWLSDEYGPHILHVAADGSTIERINPFGSGTGGRSLPKVLANRRANRGMEGLTITPDGRRLVGIMQSALDNPFDDRSSIRRNSRVTRIVTLDIETGETHQYIYLQEALDLSNSEIKALSDTRFLVLERDGLFGGNPDAPAQYKNIFRIDISKATDVSDPADSDNGLLVDGKTLEQLTEEELYAAGIFPVRKKPAFDMLESISGYAHDKPEGLALVKGNLLAIVNDDDFAISAVEGGIIQKILPGTVKSTVTGFTLRHSITSTSRLPSRSPFCTTTTANLSSSMPDPVVRISVALPGSKRWWISSKAKPTAVS